MHSQDESKFNLSHCTKCGKLLKKNSRSLITFEEHKVKSSKSKSTVPLLLLKFQKKIMMFFVGANLNYLQLSSKLKWYHTFINPNAV